MGALLSVLFFVSITTTEARPNCTGRECDDVEGRECEQGNHRNNPHCTPRVTIRPSETPYASSTPRPTSSPEQYSTPTPTASPTDNPVVSTTPTGVPQTIPSETAGQGGPSNISDGKSDGRTDSLDCIKRDCSGNKVTPQVLGAVLPATGSDLWEKVGFGVVVLLMGYALHTLAEILEGKNI
jgi:hypothetical protein